MGSLVWPTLRLFILTFNVCLIFNLVLFSHEDDNDKKNDKHNGNGHRPSSYQTMMHHRAGSLLDDCQDHSFDLRNERQRKHKSPFEKKLCSKLPLGATSSALWQNHLEEVFQASLHPLDPNQVHANWTKNLLHLMTPYFLEKGLRRSPDHGALRRIMKIIQTKLRDPQNAPPLEVAVVGGSVTEGAGCDKTYVVGVYKNEAPTIRGQPCSWPYRLQLLVDAFLGPGIIRIHNLAVGGTNSDLAGPVLDYWLFPGGSALLQYGPDVIINAYSANDNLPPADKRGDKSNTTGDFSFFLERALGRAQKFIRTSIFSRPCQEAPVVLFVDEYLGNQHNFILGELFRFEAVDLLADWYGTTGAISSAQVVRRWVYADTTEKIFSAEWIDKKGRETRDVHFGMPGHQMIAWTVAYSFLTMALEFCEEETSRGGDQPHVSVASQNKSKINNNRTVTAEFVADQDPHHRATKFAPANVLQLVQEEVPPILDPELQVADVARQWKQDAVDRRKQLQDYCHASSDKSAQALPCSFAFVAAPMGTVRNANSLNQYLNQFIVENDGWAGEQDMRNGWQNKLGFVAGKSGASVRLRIDKTPNAVKTITLHTLKSYGEKWAESQAKFSLEWKHQESGKSHQTSFNILGYHNQTTSIAYPFVLDLGPDHIAEKGSTLELQIDLIGGTTFKINAMMICSR
ncbi:expressed unknown protein [Seminavis robusta]|uniref:Uncharacterized protein n=1 Tax=Seminavis robusta TaxID=568900 RepID=A0A9N8EBN8_9STRA|nr:expressed unknown protein [Seminavis robusta]|eukprot:Sro716_g191930.1 n/a (684) ;mRNA; r:42875-44926